MCDCGAEMLAQQQRDGMDGAGWLLVLVFVVDSSSRRVAFVNFKNECINIELRGLGVVAEGGNTPSSSDNSCQPQQHRHGRW
mmetsp:Transcript_9682/g.16067  ORF Transcript_9682/g.16067 Transcript_9682/m.16067 type:complete len:82 (+) Transcript_9682:139-384(+)